MVHIGAKDAQGANVGGNGSANVANQCKLVQMAEIRANGAHDANGSANWCTLRKLVQMVLMMQLVVQIGANGEHVANGANWCKWCTRRKWCKLAHNGAPIS